MHTYATRFRAGNAGQAAVALTIAAIAAIAGLGVLAGGVYAGAIHTGPTLKLSDGWPAGRAAAVGSGSCGSRELRPVPWHAAG